MDNNNIDYKQRAIKQWTRNPIAAETSKYPEGTKEFFDDITKNRYETYAPWIKSTFKFEQYIGKRVLEVGVGTGSDHLELAKAGAILTGVDITPKSIELTKKNLDLHGYKSDLRVADAENLPFEGNTFDVVYSFGVLHHTPDTQKAIDEVYRVLKPGGKAIIALYHKYSLFWISVILYEMVFKRGFLKKSLDQRLAEVELGGKETNPLVKLFTKSQVKQMFKKFKNIKIYTRHSEIRLSGRHIDKFLNSSMIKKLFEILSKKWGWYLIIESEK